MSRCPSARETIVLTSHRICVGRHLAQASVWIILATFLATTDIDRPIDAQGEPIQQNPVFSTGLASHPGKFEVDFKSRSKEAEALLMRVVGTGTS